MLTDIAELHSAWGALASQTSEKGFLSIALGNLEARFRGGVDYPEGAEMLLVGFNGEILPSQENLPAGNGFSVYVVTEQLLPNYKFWVCICRQPGASLDLFARMAVDIVDAVYLSTYRSESWLLSLMLSRIRAWQEFMRRPIVKSLSEEEELGLFGELAVLEAALCEVALAADVVPAWVGPSGGLQDFQTERVSLEVKSTKSRNGFPVHVGSLNQLSVSPDRIALLAALRFGEQPSGRTLPDIVNAIRSLLGNFPKSRDHFEQTLLFSGYADSQQDQYLRRLEMLETRVFEINAEFPHLSQNNTRQEIRSASYVIDVDLVSSPFLALPDAFVRYGVFEI